MNTCTLSWNLGGWDIQLGRGEKLLSEGFSTFFLSEKWSSLVGLQKSSNPASSPHRWRTWSPEQRHVPKLTTHCVFHGTLGLLTLAALVISTWPEDQRSRDGGESCLVLHSLRSEKDIVPTQGSLQISKGEDSGPQITNNMSKRVKALWVL